MPIRTGLDERIKSVQNELKEYFEEAKHIYDDAIDAFTKLDSQVYSEAKRARAKAREVNWQPWVTQKTARPFGSKIVNRHADIRTHTFTTAIAV